MILVTDSNIRVICEMCHHLHKFPCRLIMDHTIIRFGIVQMLM